MPRINNDLICVLIKVAMKTQTLSEIVCSFEVVFGYGIFQYDGISKDIFSFLLDTLIKIYVLTFVMAGAPAVEMAVNTALDLDLSRHSMIKLLDIPQKTLIYINKIIFQQKILKAKFVYLINLLVNLLHMIYFRMRMIKVLVI